MKKRTDRFSTRQLGALIALLALAVWGLAVLWIHLVTPAGADMFEMTYVGTLTAMFLILLPLYWKRVRPAYMGGILMVLALLVGAVKGALDHSLVFSWSLYNVTVILAYAVALALAYFSVPSPFRGAIPMARGRTRSSHRSERQRPSSVLAASSSPPPSSPPPCGPTGAWSGAPCGV